MPRHYEGEVPEEMEDNPVLSSIASAAAYEWGVDPDELVAGLEAMVAHRPVDFRGRTVCTCGDFNCASIEHPRGGDAA